MKVELTDKEERVIGCLIEKSVVTPDQYPLTLNALVNACNQKSSREPVMNLSPGEVQHTIRSLQNKHFVVIEENFKSRAEKYSQRFCNTRYSDFKFDDAALAVVCLLLLRGPQTPGELRARSGRLHTFVDNQSVVDTLNTLVDQPHGPLVMQLPRLSGRKDSEYRHLFSGEIDVDQYLAERNAAADRQPRTSAAGSSAIQALTDRVDKLETEVAALKALLADR
ncbi:MAG: YceH family protein [Woeseiaceae bacterium]